MIYIIILSSPIVAWWCTRVLECPDIKEFLDILSRSGIDELLANACSSKVKFLAMGQHD